jgi:hypothetical protein
VTTTDGRPDLATMPYHDYLQTPEWREKARACKERAGWRCQLCNVLDRSKGGPAVLQAHHRTYERIYHEDDGDLTCLCNDCHTLFSLKGKLPLPPDDSPSLQVLPVVAGPAQPLAFRPRVFRRRTRREQLWRQVAAIRPVQVVIAAGWVSLFLGLAVLAAVIAGHT